MILRKDFLISNKGLDLEGKSPDISIAVEKDYDECGKITYKIIGYYFGSEILPLDHIKKMGLSSEPLSTNPDKITQELVYYSDLDCTIILQWQDVGGRESCASIIGFHRSRPTETSFERIGKFEDKKEVAMLKEKITGIEINFSNGYDKEDVAEALRAIANDIENNCFSGIVGFSSIDWYAIAHETEDEDE